MIRIFSLASLLAIFLASSVNGESLLLCGADTVFELKTSQGKFEKTKTWSWNAKQCRQLPENMRGLFATTDDCKPIAGGSRILISSSSSGCALVERPSGKVIWHASVPSAHSLEMLPRNRIVVAASTGPKGDCLVLFDVARSNQPIWETPLPSAHGLVWDEKRNVLWALGYDELRCYELKDWESDKPSLAMRQSYSFPDGDQSGHDLQPVPHSNDLVVTMSSHVYLFDRDKHEFRLYPDLGDKRQVKSVNIDPVTGRTVFIQAAKHAWWNDTVSFLSPADKIQLPGERLYKARWLVEKDDANTKQVR